MMTFVFVAVLAILGFLCFTGPAPPIGTRHRPWTARATAAVSRGEQIVEQSVIDRIGFVVME